MKKLLGISLVVAAVAVLASANVASAVLIKGDALNNQTELGLTNMLNSSDVGSAPRVGTSCVINFGGVANPTSNESIDVLDDVTPGNDIRVVDLAACIGLPSGSPVSMNGIGWNTLHSTVGASWLTEALMLFEPTNPGGSGGVNLRVSSTSAPGANQANSSGGTLKLANYAIPDVVLADGMLSIQFFETYEDIANGVDANWLAGSQLTLQAVPEPASLALLGLAGLALLRRRR